MRVYLIWAAQNLVLIFELWISTMQPTVSNFNIYIQKWKYENEIEFF